MPNAGGEDPVILMDMVVDHLQLLDYENKFNKKK
jgi:hypothetical protein